MKAHFHKVLQDEQSSFSIRNSIGSNFGNQWHYHPQLELHYVIRGEGVRLIGDSVQNFSAGELLLLGENLPHTWRCNEPYTQNDPAYKAEAIVIQFLPDCFGKDFMTLPEAGPMKKLFSNARNGLVIEGQTRDAVVPLMYKAVASSQMERMVTMMSVLHLVSISNSLDYISSSNAFYRSSDAENIRLNEICSYSLKNYKKDISLEEIALIANLSVTSFCRYFKQMTNKTYNDFLTEIRISQACKMLIEGKISTDAICFECGFNNVSNFYRHFKKIKGVTPYEFKRKCMYANLYEQGAM